MVEEQSFRYFVTNHQNQPLELHLATRLIVLGAGEEVEVQQEELSAPQLGVLRQNRLITTRASADDAPADAPAEAMVGKRSVKKKKEG